MGCAMRSIRVRSDGERDGRRRFVAAAGLWLTAAAWARDGDAPADPASDAPEQRVKVAGAVPMPASYVEALRTWRRPEDINAWLAERFEYDLPRALQLSESQRARSGTLPIHEPEAFFASPRGVCVDVARFAVESLRAIDPQRKAGYLMIEFDPATLHGQTLRRHWVASFERDGALYVFADSKRPGHLAGPYAGTAAFAADYALYRGREIVAVRRLPSYERQRRQLATRQPREPARP